MLAFLPFLVLTHVFSAGGWSVRFRGVGFGFVGSGFRIYGSGSSA